MVIAERDARLDRLLRWIGLGALALASPGRAAGHQPVAVVVLYAAVVVALTLWGGIRAWRVAVIFDDEGVVIRNPCRTYRLSWPEVDRMIDKYPSRGEAGGKWALAIQTVDGRRLQALGASGKPEGSPETLQKLRDIAAAHSLPAELTGAPPVAEPPIPSTETVPGEFEHLARRKRSELLMSLGGSCLLFAGMILVWPRGINPHPDYSLSALLGWPSAGLALRACGVEGDRRTLRHQMRMAQLTAGRDLGEAQTGAFGRAADPYALLSRYVRLPASAFLGTLLTAIAAGVPLGSNVFIRNSAPYILLVTIVWTAGCSASMFACVCARRIVRRSRFRRVLTADGARPAWVCCPSYAAPRRVSALIRSGDHCERVRLLLHQNPAWLPDDPITIRPSRRRRGPVSVETAGGAVYLGFIHRSAHRHDSDAEIPAKGTSASPSPRAA